MEMILLILSLSGLISGSLEACTDISTDACKLLVQALPSFCSLPSAQIECPSYCNHCSRTCFQCHEINDPSACKHSVTCGSGKECIVSETVGDDFAYHFNLGCVDKDHCTTGDLPHPPSVVGRRHLYRRNVKFGCCDSDLCNNVMPNQVTPSTCPPNTEEFTDGIVHVCYYLIKHLHNASESNKLCRAIHSHGRLAYIPSQAADAFIISHFHDEFLSNRERNHGVWIGVHDKAVEGSFVDMDGDPQKFFFWRHEQPNDPNHNDPVHDPAQDCVRMFPNDNGGKHFSWQDKPCEQDGWALCSIDIHK